MFDKTRSAWSLRSIFADNFLASLEECSKMDDFGAHEYVSEDSDREEDFLATTMEDDFWLHL